MGGFALAFFVPLPRPKPLSFAAFALLLAVTFSIGLVGIGFSALVIVVCAFMLIMDFDMIEKSAERGAPKFMEWYGAFALLVTLVWLYLEMLRLLAKIQSRD